MEDTEVGPTREGSSPAGENHREGRKLAPGDAVGRYVVLGLLGAGGMGVVYAAYDPELDRKVALKFLHPTGAASTRDSRGRERLIREAQALAKLQHPNVVTVHDVGEHERRVFVAMEFVEGPTLAQWLATAPRPRPGVLDVFLRAGQGLQAAHGKGLVHRDFKPDNVMLRLDPDTASIERVLVMDFGLATPTLEPPTPEPSTPEPWPSASASALSRSAQLADLTRTGAVMGTPAYMAPEQHRGLLADARTDQFAFCVSLYEGLYGERPFAGHTSPEIVVSCTEGTIRPAPRGSSVPRWLREVVVRGLAVVPSERWSSMAELLQALQRDPTRRRRRLAVGAMALAVLGGAFGVAQVRERGRVGECHEAADSIREVWNDDARARLEGRILGLGLGYGRETWERLQPRIDEHARAWRSARLETCIDDGGLSPELLRVQVECFEQAKASLGDQLEIFTAADATVLDRVLLALSGDASGARCLEREQLEHHLRLPDDPGERAAVVQLQRSLRKASLLRASGKYEAALQRATECRHAAQQASAPQLVASAEEERGKALADLSRFEEAEQTLETAYFGALSAADPAVARSAASRLAALTGVSLARPVDGRRWARHALTLLTAIEDPTGVRRAGIEHNLAQVEYAAGNYAEAIAYYESALAVRRRELGDHSSMTIASLTLLGSAYDAHGQPKKAIEVLAQGLAYSEATFGKHHPEVGDTLNNLGAALFASGHVDEGLSYLERALSIYEAASLQARTAATLDNLAGVYLASGDLESALASAERGLAIRRASLPADHPAIGNSLTNRSAVVRELGRRDEAMADLRAAIAVYEAAFGPEHERVSDALNNLANRYAEDGDDQRAFELHRRALDIYRKVLTRGHPKIATSAFHLGWMAVRTHRYDIAVDETRFTLDAIDPATPMPASSEALLRFVLGLALQGRQEPEPAYEELRKAHDLAPPQMAPANRRAIDFALARAMWETKRDRPGALQIARAVRDEARADATPDAELEEIEQWLRTHG